MHVYVFPICHHMVLLWCLTAFHHAVYTNSNLFKQQIAMFMATDEASFIWHVDVQRQIHGNDSSILK